MIPLPYTVHTSFALASSSWVGMAKSSMSSTAKAGIRVEKNAAEATPWTKARRPVAACKAVWMVLVLVVVRDDVNAMALGKANRTKKIKW